MKLEEVRALKTKLRREMADVEVTERDIVDTEFKKYADRLIALMNKVEKGSGFCISFVPEGETERVNVLPPTHKVGLSVLRDLALRAIIERLDRRAAKDGQEIDLLMEVVPIESE